MQTYIKRSLKEKILEYMSIFPAVAILGPRQCGKSTLAQLIGASNKNFIYLDLENPSDIKKIDDASLFFDINPNKTICLDEVQNRSDIFPELRGIIDKNRQNGRILLLGSASQELINTSSESLAGRIGYIELTPFTINEIIDNNKTKQTIHWLRGGFPPAFLSKDDKSAFIWLKSYLRSYIERDLNKGSNIIPILTIQRLLQMLANNQGQLFNSSKISASLGISYNTVRNYVDFFEKSFLVRVLQPYKQNLNKRLTKSPKIYIRDSGLLHSILEIDNINQLFGHPVFGSSWENYAMENIINQLTEWRPRFYRTATGSEVDLILTKGNKMMAFEFKTSTAPDITKETHVAINDLNIKELFVVAPVNKSWQMSKNIKVGNILNAIEYAHQF
ncbi:ATP-binding protein [Bacteroidota bacterium]